MNNIQEAYIDALLSDATYALEGKKVPEGLFFDQQ